MRFRTKVLLAGKTAETRERNLAKAMQALNSGKV
jgi:hypothetical protein